MRLAVFGATGRTGRLVVERASAIGLDVTAPVRAQPREPFGDSAEPVVIDLHDRGSVTSVLQDAAVVVSAIGPIVGETRTEVSDVTRTLVGAMGDAGLRRIVAAANAKVFTDDEVTGEYANVAAEHRRDAATLRASNLDWTILAPPFLNDDPPTGDVVTVVDGRGPGRSLTRGDFAGALLDAVDRTEWIGHIVGITNP
jgi:putative NADH-flavin reductase